MQQETWPPTAGHRGWKRAAAAAGLGAHGFHGCVLCREGPTGAGHAVGQTLSALRELASPPMAQDRHGDVPPRETSPGEVAAGTRVSSGERTRDSCDEVTSAPGPGRAAGPAREWGVGVQQAGGNAKGWAWLGAGPAVRERSLRARAVQLMACVSFWVGAEKQVVRSQRKPPAGVFQGPRGFWAQTAPEAEEGSGH